MGVGPCLLAPVPGVIKAEEECLLEGGAPMRGSLLQAGYFVYQRHSLG